ncbi:hypothetical protein HF521_021306 [Silurus meridionalis]|uniref:Uncharacterized protein n=1 Tax=Silurus meridionalis TaxID=175797 RepID=A0A8T0BAZ0_SILME|nr:hypothetical protein HF521_021306 [Silurus meridionalis]
MTKSVANYKKNERRPKFQPCRQQDRRHWQSPFKRNIIQRIFTQSVLILYTSDHEIRVQTEIFRRTSTHSCCCCCCWIKGGQAAASAGELEVDAVAIAVVELVAGLEVKSAADTEEDKKDINVSRTAALAGLSLHLKEDSSQIFNICKYELEAQEGAVALVSVVNKDVVFSLTLAMCQSSLRIRL